MSTKKRSRIGSVYRKTEIIFLYLDKRAVSTRKERKVIINNS